MSKEINKAIELVNKSFNIENANVDREFDEMNYKEAATRVIAPTKLVKAALDQSQTAPILEDNIDDISTLVNHPHKKKQLEDEAAKSKKFYSAKEEMDALIDGKTLHEHTKDKIVSEEEAKKKLKDQLERAAEEQAKQDKLTQQAYQKNIEDYKDLLREKYQVQKQIEELKQEQQRNEVEKLKLEQKHKTEEEELKKLNDKKILQQQHLEEKNLSKNEKIKAQDNITSIDTNISIVTANKTNSENKLELIDKNIKAKESDINALVSRDEKLDDLIKVKKKQISPEDEKKAQEEIKKEMELKEKQEKESTTKVNAAEEHHTEAQRIKGMLNGLNLKGLKGGAHIHVNDLPTNASMVAAKINKDINKELEQGFVKQSFGPVV